MIGASGLDQTVFDWFVEHREPWLTTIMRVISVLGGSVFLVPLVLAVGAWYWKRHGVSRPFNLLAVAYGGSYLVSQSVKVLVGRARPPASSALGHFSGYAFPSGHATQAAAVYGMLAFVLAVGASRWRGKVSAWAGAGLIVAVIGTSRLYLGAHWLTDVLGGWALGTLWALVVGALTPQGVRRRRTI